MSTRERKGSGVCAALFADMSVVNNALTKLVGGGEVEQREIRTEGVSAEV